MGRRTAHERPPRAPVADPAASSDVDWDDERIVTRLRQAGLRATDTRRRVIALLGAVRAHPTVEELQQLLRDHGREVRQATLYQSLARLVQAGVITSFVDNRGLMRFDAEVDAHPHLICTSCGRIADLEPSHAEECTLDGLAAGLTRDHQDWRVSHAHLELRALCPRCVPGTETRAPAPGRGARNGVGS